MSQVSSETVGTSSGRHRSQPITVAAIVVLVLLAASYAINAADRQVFPVLLSAITKHYGFSLSEGGFLATIFTLGIGLGGIPAGRLADRLSRKNIMVIGIAIYSVFTILTPLAFGFADMAAYRTLSGVGESLQNAALFSAVGAYFYARRSLALGVLNVSYGVGGALGPLIGARLFSASGSWSLPFYVFGIVGFLFVLAILLTVDKVFTEAKDTGRARAVAGAESSPLPGTLLNRTSLVLCLACAAAGLSLYSYLGLYPTFLQTHLGLSVNDSGLAASMFGIGSLVASIPAGYLGDRFGNRIIVQISFLCAIVVGGLMFMAADTVAEQTALSFLEGAFGSGFVYVNLYAALQRSLRPSLVGRASGAFVTCFFLPSALAGYLFAQLVKSTGWAGATIVQLMFFPLIGAILMAFVRLPEPPGRAHPGDPNGHHELTAIPQEGRT
jgi:MFS family permease